MTEDVTPTPIPAATAAGSSRLRATIQPPIGVTTASATTIANARPSIPPSRGSRETRCARTMYSANSTAFANANASPSGWPAICTSTIR